WVGVLSELPTGEFNSVVRLKRDGSEAFPPVPLARGFENVIRTIAAAEGVSGGVYVGGDFSEGIFRLNEDGSLDAGFDVVSGFDGPVSTIIPAADGTGDIYVGGFFSQYKGADVGGLVRLKDDGSLDANFAGIREIQAVAMAGPTYPGSVYSGGYAPLELARWFSTGSRDPSFNLVGNLDPVFSIALVSGAFGAVYAGGGFSGGIYRISNTGVTDGAFVVGSGFNNSVRKIVHTEGDSGDIYVVGEFTTYQGSAANGLVRLNKDGSPVDNFLPGTGFSNSDGLVPFGEFASSALATDTSGDLYVGGDFTDYDGTTADGLVRLKNNGLLDPDFEARISSETGICTDGTFAKDD
ncbi:MAG TPA: delta-60 repeat domain-containing protein, partial [Gammaproteobacteria bacterium]|nr:delta-60 repeat domain-containing protein [Gammaproteobacteria bacterium]